MAFQNDVDDVVDFLLTPFIDIVSRAKDAADHAGDEEPSMRKTAENLSKEGQRAVNRLEPLCRKICIQHGSSFVKAMKTNEEISQYHMELTDLLWGFDDFVTIETFDKEKYTELQTLCRSSAPKIYNILVRTNIELLSRLSDSDSSLRIMPESPPTSPMYPLSPSSFTWQPENKMDTEPPLLGTAPWDENLVNSLHIQSQANQRKLGRRSPATTVYSASAPGLEYATINPKRQSYSSAHSSGSSASQSSRGKVRRSILPIREQRELSTSSSQGHPFPQPLSSRDVHEAYRSPRSVPIAGRISSQESSTFGTPPDWKPPAKAVPPTPVIRLPSKGCVINESSSFRQYGGFCSGAKDIIKGSVGVKQKQKPVHRTLSRVVAKCTGCAWELDYEHIENDQSNKESGSMTKMDVNFRLRLLQKSHMAVKRPNDRLYGCVFCVQNGYTMEESDATVFFSADDLLAHLSRHLRPLPVVSGVTVVYGTDVPSHLLNNFDLQFKVPAKPNPIHRESTEIDGRPTGIAMKETRRDDTQRNIVDRDRPEELQVATRARLTGIKWPPQYKGRRVFAWHDGTFASLLSEVIMLTAPANCKLSRATRTFVSAKAKWKFSPKHGKAGWLKFDKGDTITNIGWEHPDHWCWCGTTSKGEWGIFPQAFIDPNTVRDDTPDNPSPD